MAFTSTDLTNIESAIVSLATGERVVSVTLSDGKTIRYSEVDLPRMQTLRDIIKGDLGVGCIPKFNRSEIKRF